MKGKSWKLNPSDFAFLWDECRRCFYEKVVLNQPRPRTPMPKVFTVIDLLMKEHFQGAAASSLTPELPPGAVEFSDTFLRSAPIVIPGQKSSCYIVGRLDTAVSFDDGSFGVIDFKTSLTKDNHVEKYGRQLHAYAYALEHPAPKAAGLSPVEILGLLCVEPSSMADAEGGYAFNTTPVWIPIEKDEDAFLGFVDEVLGVLEAGTAPDPGERCPWCSYLKSA